MPLKRKFNCRDLETIENDFTPIIKIGEKFFPLCQLTNVNLNIEFLVEISEEEITSKFFKIKLKKLKKYFDISWDRFQLYHVDFGFCVPNIHKSEFYSHLKKYHTETNNAFFIKHDGNLGL